MNNIKEKIDSALGMLSTDKDLVSAAKIRAAAERRKIPAKRIFGTAAAVCGILICGVTAAAATGLIDFEAVFGDYIVVKNSELANSLVGKVKNFKYKVSDSDYKIEIKGVTGTDKNIIGIAEISRVDGTPVIDHFVNPTGETYLSALWEHADMDLLYGSTSAGGIGSINDDGNIEYYFEVSGDRNLAGKKFKVESKNFYPNEAYLKYKFDKKIHYMEWRDFSGYVQADESWSASHDNINPADVDDSDIIALELEWEFSFTYNPSEASMKTKKLLDPEDDFIFYQYSEKIIYTEDGGGYADPDSRIDFETAVNCTQIEVGPMNGHIKFEYELTEYHQQSFFGTYWHTKQDNDKNVVFLITADGGTIPVKFGGFTGSGGGDGELFQCDYELVYTGEDYRKEIIETENVTAISINGTVYELK